MERYPKVSYTARIEISETEIINLMSIQYSGHASYQVSWSAWVFSVERAEDGIITYVPNGHTEISEHTYPCHVDAIEAGVAHFLRQRDQTMYQALTYDSRDDRYHGVQRDGTEIQIDADAFQEAVARRLTDEHLTSGDNTERNRVWAETADPDGWSSDMEGFLND